MTALISVLDTNGGTDAPGQSVVSPEVGFNGPLTGGFVALCLMADRVAKHKLPFNRLLGFPRTEEILQSCIRGQHNKVGYECFTNTTCRQSC